MCPGNFGAVQSAPIIVITVVAAVVRVHRLVRHERLVGVIHGSDMRRNLSRRRIQLALVEVTVSVGVKVEKQIGITVLRLTASRIGIAKEGAKVLRSAVGRNQQHTGNRDGEKKSRLEVS